MFVIMVDVDYGTFLFIYVGTSPKPQVLLHITSIYLKLEYNIISINIITVYQEICIFIITLNIS